MLCTIPKGADGIITEMIKFSSTFIIPIFHNLFNTIFDTAVFPDEWAKALIMPLLKKGAASDPNNYRGISLSSALSKVYMKIMYNRLSNWVENNNVLAEEQAGFRKGRSTTDNIFVFQCLVQKYLSKKGGRCYSLMVDFSKALDSVPHKSLWYKLLNIGIHGKIIKGLQSMYSKLNSAVVLNNSTSEYFKM